MKKLILIITILLSGMLVQAQTDVEIADALIGKPFSRLESVLDTMGLEYYITTTENKVTELYIVKNNSVRLWEIKHEDLYRTKKREHDVIRIMAGKDLITEIFVRYRHSNLNDLREFHAYDAPEDSKYREYEKSPGSKLSHLRVTQS